MSNITENNKRIAKNTLMLYVRMIFMMAVSLYTSRVVLNTLGVQDYGIYNVVGGIVVMISFINSSMSAATQRYLTFELGKGNLPKIKEVFVTSVNIHIIISVIILIIAETIGLWFLLNKMTIPESRVEAAVIVYQCSILVTIVSFISVPYNATIIAHEKMSAFAYISILEAIVKLAIVYLLLLINFDKLILYAIFMLVVQILIRLVYGRYCRKHFSETKYSIYLNKKLFKEMFLFSGWNLWGSMAGVASSQGLNILLNMFFSPTVNAARAIAVQVQNAITQFSVNFQAALNPQIIKSYAIQNYEYMHSLIFRSSRFTFLLLMCISLPVFFETDMILKLWLKTVPEYSATFLRIIMCVTIIDAMANPIMTSAQATGKVKVYQSVIGGILLLILPISYATLKLGGAPYSVFIVHLIICISAFITRLLIIRPMINLKLREYFKNVIFKCILTCLMAVVFPLFLKLILHNSIYSSIIICLISVISGLLASFCLGMTSHERKVVLNKIRNIESKLLNVKYYK